MTFIQELWTNFDSKQLFLCTVKDSMTFNINLNGSSWYKEVTYIRIRGHVAFSKPGKKFFADIFFFRFTKQLCVIISIASNVKKAIQKTHVTNVNIRQRRGTLTMGSGFSERTSVYLTSFWTCMLLT